MSELELVDSHAHLTDGKFAGDLDAVVERAQAAGVVRIVTLGTDVAESRAAIELAERYPMVYAAVGIHPESVREAAPDDLRAIRDIAAHPRVVAIGEIGLDYYWDRDSAALQQEWFERQLDLAAELRLPAAIHDRDAHDKIMGTLEARRGEGLRGVLHAFSGDEAMAQQALELGFCISLAGPVTFLNARRAPALVASLPLEGLLVETDSPYLAPHPLRGQRNEPANVARVAGRVAEIKELAVQQVAARTTENARRLFGM